MLIADIKAMEANTNPNPHGLTFSLWEPMLATQRINNNPGICELAIHMVHDVFIAQVNVLDFLTEKGGECTSVVRYVETYMSEDMLSDGFFLGLLRYTFLSGDHVFDCLAFEATSSRSGARTLEGNKMSVMYLMSHLQASAFLGGLQKVPVGERELVIMLCGELMSNDFVLERWVRWKTQCPRCGMFWLELRV
jgi:hypothetical protein